VIKQDGTAVEIEIGDKSEDPIFMITDLLPHLAKQRMKKNYLKQSPLKL